MRTNPPWKDRANLTILPNQRRSRELSISRGRSSKSRTDGWPFSRAGARTIRTTNIAWHDAAINNARHRILLRAQQAILAKVAEQPCEQRRDLFDRGAHAQLVAGAIAQQLRDLSQRVAAGPAGQFDRAHGDGFL